jgi:hypothetical protein
VKRKGRRTTARRNFMQVQGRIIISISMSYVLDEQKLGPETDYLRQISKLVPTSRVNQVTARRMTQRPDQHMRWASGSSFFSACFREPLFLEKAGWRVAENLQ